MSAIQQLLQRDTPVKWLFTGDSITHGAKHTIGWRDYVELFSERVRWELGRGRDVVIKTGISGWTIEKIAEDLDWNVLQFQPDCVSIMVGMNDCPQGPAGLDRFRETYLATIDRIRSATGAELMLRTYASSEGCLRKRTAGSATTWILRSAGAGWDASEPLVLKVDSIFGRDRGINPPRGRH